MNNKEDLAPELEKLISKVKLKEPPQELMRNYLSGVNAKINQGTKGNHFGFPQLAVFLVIGMALAGFLYFFLVLSQIKPVSEVKPVSVRQDVVSQGAQVLNLAVSKIRNSNTISAQKSLTLEEELAILEAFGEEFSDESSDVLGDDEAIDELVVLDEIELSPGFTNQASRI